MSAAARISVRVGLAVVAVVVLLVAAWALLGFYYVPGYVQREIPRFAEEKLKHTARVGEVRFNPFTLRASLSNFVLEDKAGHAVLGFESAEIVPRWTSVLRRAVVLSEIRLAAPYVNAVVDKSGQLNLARLVPASPKSDKPAELPSLDIGRIEIAKGRVGLEDQREGFHDAVDNIALSLTNLNTEPKEEGEYSLTAEAPAGGKVRWSGKLALNPILATGSLSLADVSLKEFSPYLPSGELVSGKANAELAYRLELPGGEPRLRVSGAKLGVRDLGYVLAGSNQTASNQSASNQPASGDAPAAGDAPKSAKPAQVSKPQGPLLRLAQIAVDGVDLDWNARRATASSITLGNGLLTAAGGASQGGSPLARLAQLAVKDVNADLKAQQFTAAAVTVADAQSPLQPLSAAAGAGPAIRLAQLALQSATLDLNGPKLGATTINVGDMQFFDSADASAPAGRLARLDLQGVNADLSAQRFAATALDAADFQYAPATAAANPSAKLARLSVQGAEINLGAKRYAAGAIDAVDFLYGDAASPLAKLARLGVQAADADLGAQKFAAAALNAADLQYGAVAKLARLSLQGANVDLTARRFAASALNVADGQLAVSRDARGEIELPRLFAAQAATNADASARAAAVAEVKASAETNANVPAKPWSASVGAIDVQNIAATYRDATAKTPLAANIEGLRARGKLELSPGDKGLQARIEGGEVRLTQFAAGDGTDPAATPVLLLGDLAVSGVRLDQAANVLNVERVGIGALRSGTSLRDGRIALQDLLPKFESDPDAPPLAYAIGAVELSDGSFTLADLDHQLDLALEQIRVKGTGVLSDRSKPLSFDVAARVKSGGNVALRGSLVPATGTLDTTLKADGLALAPLQVVLSRYAAVRLTTGTAALDGKLEGTLHPPTQVTSRAQRAAGTPRPARTERALAYRGDITLANVALTDEQGGPLIAWQSLVADDTRLRFSPPRVDIDELRLSGPTGRFAIAKDGSTNLSHLARTGQAADKATQSVTDRPSPAALRGQTPSAAPAPGSGSAAPTTAAAAAGGSVDAAPAVEVSVRRITVAKGTLEYADANIEPGFSANITGLSGNANGLSNARETRTQFTLEGNVGEFGFARLSGTVNVYAPRDRTTFRVEMRNIDMPSVTPYAMRFAGYRIATGRMNLDLNYRVRGSVIEGDNRIVLNQFTLGEKVESPRALDLPLELAISLLKEPDGTINVELPVTGNLDDPQFSIAPLVWKAVGNLLGNIITAPFRALARLFGGGANAEEAGSINFEVADSRLLPPEREKLQKIAGVMNQKKELKLRVPAQYDEAADTRALKREALSREVARRAGLDLAAEDNVTRINTEDRRTRTALRALFTERFSAAEYQKLVTEAEAKDKAAGGNSGSSAAGNSANSAPTNASANSASQPNATEDDALIAPSKGEENAQPSGVIGRTLERARRAVAGEPQVADLRSFYANIARRLRDAQPVASEALQKLGRERAAAVASGLRMAGVAADRIDTLPPQASAQSASGQGGGSARQERGSRSFNPDSRYVKLNLELAAAEKR